MRNILAKAFNNRFIRFLFTGGINTIITYGVYLVLLEAVNYQISYAVSYVTGIIFTFFLNKLFVFRSDKGWRTVAFYPLIYLIQYLFGVLTLYLISTYTVLDIRFAPFVVIVLSIPLTYLLSKLVFVGNENKLFSKKIENKKRRIKKI